MKMETKDELEGTSQTMTSFVGKLKDFTCWARVVIKYALTCISRWFNNLTGVFLTF